MATMANSFIDKVNFKQGREKVEELLDKEYASVVAKTQFIDNVLTCKFNDDSKARVDFNSEVPMAKELLAYKAHPFVKVKIGEALVCTNNTGDVIIEFPGKMICIKSISKRGVSISGPGQLTKYNGNVYEFD